MRDLAVLFALSKEEAESFKTVPRAVRSDYMHDNIEDIFFDEHLEYTQELETSWDAMHRMLTDGSLNVQNQHPPLCNVILGGEILYGLKMEDHNPIYSEEESDQLIILKTPEQVREIAEALPKRTKEACRMCYDRIDSRNYGNEKNDEDFEYTWQWLQRSLVFWPRAAKEKRYVLFAADQ